MVTPDIKKMTQKDFYNFITNNKTDNKLKQLGEHMNKWEDQSLNNFASLS